MSSPRGLSPSTDPTLINVSAATVSGAEEVFSPTRGYVKALIDGREAFDAMYEKMMAAERFIYLSVWWMQFETVLKRGHKITDVLRHVAHKGVKVRVLVSFLDLQEFHIGPLHFRIFDETTTPATKVKNTLEAMDMTHIQVVIAKHPHTIQALNTTITPGSFHEKFMVIDGQYAFCGGIEFATDYTDADPTHAKSLRHDVHSLIQGPVVKDFERHFVTRWREAKGPNDANLPDPVDHYEPKKDRHAVQVAITKSKHGHGGMYKTLQQDIFDAYTQAISEATQYIYIENQYFRDKHLTDALVKRIKKQKDLQLIILLPSKPEEKDNPFTRHANFVQRTQIEALRAADAQRVGVYSVRRPQGDKKDIYVHSKIMIVDDKWATIGSANANPRGFFLDSEINILVRDEAFAKDLRLKLWQEHLELLPQAKLDLANAKNFVGVWNEQARENDERIKKKQRLKGRAHTHIPPQGKKLELSEYITWLKRILLPDLDDYL